MSQEMCAHCRRCERDFFYSRRGLHSRPRVYCDACLHVHRQEATKLRVRAYRQRQREAKEANHKQPDDNSPRPVADGSRKGTARATPRPVAGGLFAGVPNPGRTTKRKAMGLP